jgi:hypothetical protein
VFESVTERKPMSRGFRCALFGIAMTVLARLTPWLWPGWPAMRLLDFVLARAAPSVAGPVQKGVGLVVLVFVNVAAWALAAWLVVGTLVFIRERMLRRN